MLNPENESTETLRTYLEKYQKASMKQDEFIFQVFIDEQEVDIDTDKSLSRPITRKQKIKVVVRDLNSLTLESLSSSDEYVSYIGDLARCANQAFQENDLENANTQFLKLIDYLEMFMQLAHGIKVSVQRLKNHEQDPVFTQIQELEIGFLTLFKQMVDAREKSDTVILGDLLEYELTDRLEQWKDQIKPQLMSLLRES